VIRNGWGAFGPFGYCTKLGANRFQLVQKGKSSCIEVASEFFTTKAPDPYHWILNSCSGAFRNVWVHLGLFFYGTKFEVELVQLMQ